MLYPEIINLKPFTVVGFTSRHKLPNVRATHDIPLYWETINLDYAQPLTRLHDLFNQSKHTEYTVCFNINAATDEFTYLLGVGVDNDADKAKIEPDMYVMQMPGGQYARFTTPLVKAEESTQNTRDTWNKIFEDWLPNSPYRFDEKRFDFEYYDERDHPWENNGMSQIEIFIPTSQR